MGGKRRKGRRRGRKTFAGWKFTVSSPSWRLHCYKRVRLVDWSPRLPRFVSPGSERETFEIWFSWRVIRSPDPLRGGEGEEEGRKGRKGGGGEREKKRGKNSSSICSYCQGGQAASPGKSRLSRWKLLSPPRPSPLPTLCQSFSSYTCRYSFPPPPKWRAGLVDYSRG